MLSNIYNPIQVIRNDCTMRKIQSYFQSPLRISPSLDWCVTVVSSSSVFDSPIVTFLHLPTSSQSSFRISAGIKKGHPEFLWYSKTTTTTEDDQTRFALNLQYNKLSNYFLLHSKGWVQRGQENSLENMILHHYTPSILARIENGHCNIVHLLDSDGIDYKEDQLIGQDLIDISIKNQQKEGETGEFMNQDPIQKGNDDDKNK